MIIQKLMFDKPEKWPFSVDKLAVFRFDIGHNPCFDIENNFCFVIVHNYKSYALSGILEGYGFLKLEDSDIWADNQEIPGTKKSLTSFFEFCKWHSKEKHE